MKNRTIFQQIIETFSFFSGDHFSIEQMLKMSAHLSFGTTNKSINIELDYIKTFN